MPIFEWNIDPVLVRIPKTTILYAITGLGILSVLGALIRKNKELLSTGLVIGLLAALGWVMMKSDFEIRYYSLLFVLVFLGGHTLLNWQIKRGGGTEEDAGDFIVYGIVGVLAGSRLGHVLFYDLDHALEDPLWVLRIWEGGLASHGAVVGLILAMFIFTKRRGLPFLEGADRFAFSAALGATLVRLGNFFNSEIVGRPTDQSWGVRFLRFPEPGGGAAQLRHPSQLYEVSLGLLCLFALYVVDRLAGKEKRPRGLLIAAFFSIYFTGRFLVEFVKEFQIEGEAEWALTMGQFLSLPGAALGYYGVYWALKNRLPVGFGDAQDDASDDLDDESDDEADDDEAAESSEDKETVDLSGSDEEADDDAEAESEPSGIDPDVAAEFDKHGVRKRNPDAT